MTEDENDESKIFYTQIGYTTLKIDEVFAHIVQTNQNDFSVTKSIFTEADDLNISS